MGKIFAFNSISYIDLLQGSFIQFLDEKFQFLFIFIIVDMYLSQLDIIVAKENPVVNARSTDSYENCTCWNKTQGKERAAVP